MVNHPHIIHLEKVFESPKKIYLILELCREELATEFKKKKRFTEDETRYVLKQLVSAVCYLHKNCKYQLTKITKAKYYYAIR